MAINNRLIGSVYEKQACHKLTESGYKIIEKNFRCKLGEIDLIALHGEYLVFVEVKYRNSVHRYGYASEAVDTKKQATIYKVAQWYLCIHKQYINRPCRFDVVAIDGSRTEIIKNAFGGF